MTHVDTLIIGGGIAGLSCGRALAAAQHDFRLVSDRLGGRMFAAPDGLNFGAAYVTSDYRHVLPLTERGPRNRKRDVYYWDGQRFITVASPRNVWRLPGLARLYRLVIPFHRRLNQLRSRVVHTCQTTLLEQDPVLRRYVSQPAADFVQQQGLEEITEIFCGPLFQSTLFVPWQETNAFYYLANLAPAFLPVYTVDVRPAVGRLTAGWSHRIHHAKATAVQEEQGGDRFRVLAGDQELLARNLILAVPDRNALELYPLESHARDIPYCTLHIRGTRRATCLPGKTVFFRPEHPIRCLWPQTNGMDIAFGPDRDPDLSEYYTDYEIVRALHWKTALQLSAERWRPLKLRPNLFAIGDHNIIGLEDTYLTGLYAANQILGQGRA